MTSNSPPKIPERYSSLLSSSRRQNLDRIIKRKASASSQLSVASTANEWVDKKTVEVGQGIAYFNELQAGLMEAHKSGHLGDFPFREAVKAIETDRRPKQKEFLLLKRQNKIIIDDLTEEGPSVSTMEEAYTSLICKKVMAASAKVKKQKKYDQAGFKKRVLEHYNAVRTLPSGSRQFWCHVMGWMPECVVKAAHLVPKSLESREVSHLFGVDDEVLSEARNGMFSICHLQCGII
jgi:hypothetical protein